MNGVPVVQPIGTFLTMFDAPLQAAVLAGSQAIMTWVAPIAGMIAILYYLLQGLRWANGDPSVAHGFIPQMMRIVFLLWLCSNAVAFNTWIYGLLYIGLPQAMTTVLAGSMGANTTNVAAGVASAAAVFDQVWDLMLVVVGTVWKHSGWTDWATWLAAAATAITCGLCIVANAIIYFLSRLLLGIIMILGPAILACGLAETTRPVLDRAFGKVLSLILLQVCAIIVLQILLTGDLQFMQTLVAGSQNLPPSTPAAVQQFFANGGSVTDATAGELAQLAAMVVWFFAGAFAMYALPAIAYSLGTGVMTSALPAVIGAAAAARYLGGPPGGGGGRRPGGGGPPGNWNVGGPPYGPSYDVSLRRDPLPGGSGRRAVAAPRALPPPPPPSLANSTRS